MIQEPIQRYDTRALAILNFMLEQNLTDSNATMLLPFSPWWKTWLEESLPSL